MRNTVGIALMSSLWLSGCGIKEKIEQRVAEEVAEKAIEVAAGGEVDVETRDGKVSIEGKNGEKLVVDADGTTRITDADGKVIDVAQGSDGSSTIKGSDGLEVTNSTTIPADFPISLPAIKQVTIANRTIEPNGQRSFMAGFEAESGEIEPVVTALKSSFEAKGLTVTRNDVTAPEASFVTLGAVDTAGKINVSAVVASEAGKGAQVMITWADASAVAP